MTSSARSLSRSAGSSRSRSRLLRLALLLMAALAVVGLVVVFNPLQLLPDSDSDSADAADAPRSRGEITLADLSTTLETDGELRLAEQRVVSADASGTLTAVADLGSSVAPSSALYEIDGVPTVALVGDVPAWRTMTVDDVGVDVEQLETNLVALGYDTTGELTVDDTFTAFTAEVVARWQADMALEETGVVAFGSVVFVPADANVSTVSATVGSPAQGEVLVVASAERELVFPVSAELLDTIDIGSEVSARLPDRSTVAATVIELGPTGAGDWEAVAAISTLGAGEPDAGDTSEEVALPEGDAIPLAISWVEEIASDAKTVRADALARLDNGSYVVEVVGASGSTEFVPVEIGARSGSTVEILTDLPVGTVIITS